MPPQNFCTILTILTYCVGLAWSRAAIRESRTSSNARKSGSASFGRTGGGDRRPGFGQTVAPPSSGGFGSTGRAPGKQYESKAQGHSRLASAKHISSDDFASQDSGGEW